ncbi:MAG: hypothetical protein PHY02_03810 [Phycisphaerae bacterium]|nr:hypothetical protein [Phycisphaerae bacterium]
MAKQPQKNRKGGSQTAHANLPELVTVTFVEDLEQAKEYETLLGSNNIPVTIKEQHGDPEDLEDTNMIAIMVPEEYLDEAHVVIESQDAYDDFYDLGLEDEDEDNFDSDLFDDDF